MTLPLFDTTPPPRKPHVLHQGRTAESRAASREAGERATATGKCARDRAAMLALYRQRGSLGVTDSEASRELDILRYAVPARRLELAETHRFEPAGRRDGATVFVLKEER